MDSDKTHGTGDAPHTGDSGMGTDVMEYLAATSASVAALADTRSPGQPAPPVVLASSKERETVSFRYVPVRARRYGPKTTTTD